MVDKDHQLNSPDESTIEETNTNKNRMEIRFSCGEEGIKKYIEDGWVILEEYTEEKICTWKSVPATKDCDMDKDKGCKITKPDKIGKESIYLLEK
tara:strand:+ start:853 stop:1137 length:285 start_codon:yes stop_codon:yes gene_type:complete